MEPKDNNAEKPRRSRNKTIKMIGSTGEFHEIEKSSSKLDKKRSPQNPNDEKENYLKKQEDKVRARRTIKQHCAALDNVIALTDEEKKLLSDVDMKNDELGVFHDKNKNTTTDEEKKNDKAGKSVSFYQKKTGVEDEDDELELNKEKKSPNNFNETEVKRSESEQKKENEQKKEKKEKEEKEEKEEKDEKDEKEVKDEKDEKEVKEVKEGNKNNSVDQKNDDKDNNDGLKNLKEIPDDISEKEAKKLLVERNINNKTDGNTQKQMDNDKSSSASKDIDKINSDIKSNISEKEDKTGRFADLKGKEKKDEWKKFHGDDEETYQKEMERIAKEKAEKIAEKEIENRKNPDYQKKNLKNNKDIEIITAGESENKNDNKKEKEQDKDEKNQGNKPKQDKQNEENEKNEKKEQNVKTEYLAAGLIPTTETNTKQVNNISSNKNEYDNISLTPINLVEVNETSEIGIARHENQVFYEGYAYKKRFFFSCCWHSRYFVLTKDGSLKYYKDLNGKGKGEINIVSIRDVQRLDESNKPFPFKIILKFSDREDFMGFNEDKERNKWAKSLSMGRKSIS